MATWRIEGDSLIVEHEHRGEPVSVALWHGEVADHWTGWHGYCADDHPAIHLATGYDCPLCGGDDPHGGAWCPICDYCCGC